MSHSYRHKRIGESAKGQHSIGSLVRQCSQEGIAFKASLKGDRCGSGERRLL